MAHHSRGTRGAGVASTLSHRLAVALYCSVALRLLITHILIITTAHTHKNIAHLTVARKEWDTGGERRCGGKRGLGKGKYEGEEEGTEGKGIRKGREGRVRKREGEAERKEG